MTMTYCILPARSVIRISGVDSASFLQGLITNNILKATPEHGIYSALLTAQGKFLYDFFILHYEDGYLLETQRDDAESLIKKLSLYRLRSHVSIEPAHEFHVAVAWGDGVDALSPPAQSSASVSRDIVTCLRDPRIAKAGMRLLGSVENIHAYAEKNALHSATEADYDRWRILLGLPDGKRDIAVEKDILLEYGFEALNGVDFSKGCYMGQELTARTKYRALLKKHLYQVTAPAPLPAHGTPITLGGVDAGEMRTSAGDAGLALLRDEMVQKSTQDNIPLMAGNITLSAQLPVWMPRE